MILIQYSFIHKVKILENARLQGWFWMGTNGDDQILKFFKIGSTGNQLSQLIPASLNTILSDTQDLAKSDVSKIKNQNICNHYFG